MSIAAIYIAGNTDQQNKLRLLCNDLRDTFTNELPASPADIPPFDMNVDDTKYIRYGRYSKCMRKYVKAWVIEILNDFVLS
jgi:hypothetical protein